jgi:DNA-binding transcriptional MerR regulator
MKLLPEAPSLKSNNEPLYNIGVVTRMTGISMATLRAWERRYDFPEAGRTSGGHRLYSERDIMRLRWVKSRIEEGMQTAQAIQALLHQEENGAILEAPEIRSTIPYRTNSESPHSSTDVYQQQLFNALVQRNLQKCDQLLGEALAVYSPEDLIYHVISPAMAAIGTAWENNQISIATEHLATNYLRQRMLMWMVSGPPPLVIPPIVLACAPGEWHEGSLLMVGALLRRKRYPVAYLGQAVPLPDLSSFISDIKPNVVVVVAMTEESARELIDWPRFLPETTTSGKPVICFGGRIFSKDPTWQQRMPGVYLGNNILEGLETLERIISTR